jgi:hypothetical protein
MLVLTGTLPREFCMIENKKPKNLNADGMLKGEI